MLAMSVDPASGLGAQDPDRIWGRVVLEEGETIEGYLRWDRNEAVWDDVLDGQHRPDEAEVERLRVLLADDPDRRSVEVLGIRVSWKEEDDLSVATSAGVRFRWISRLTPDGDDADLELVTGERVRLMAASSDLGSGFRGLEVEMATGLRTVEWEEIAEVRFAPAPVERRSERRRLYGTVESESGLRFTGWVAWDRDEVFASEILDGEEGEIAFDEIAAIERVRSGVRATLVSGEEVMLSGTNDVDSGNRGIEVNDPGLGRVVLDWRAFASLRLHPPAADGPTADRGGVLRGELRTEAGDVLEGEIVWDLDESAGWEFLDGTVDDIEFDVELSRVEEIRKRRDGGVDVVLRDGRRLRLAGSNDVDEGNRGIVVRSDEGTDRLVDWSGFASVRFAGSDP